MKQSKFDSISKELLTTLFIKENLTRKEIAKQLNLSEGQVKRLLTKFNITKPQHLKKLLWQGIAHTAGKKWYNNGIVETLADECPEGYTPGKLKTTSEKIKNALIGHKVSEETKDKIRQKAIGKIWSEDAKQKLSLTLRQNHPMAGKTHTAESKQKIKEARAKQVLPTPMQDKLNSFLDNTDLNKYVNNNTVNLDQLFDDAEMVNISGHRQIVYNAYKKKGFNVSFNKKHIAQNQFGHWLTSIYTGNILQNTRQILPSYELDFYFPELNIAIEYNGTYWHSTRHVNKTYHYQKSLACRKQGIRLIHIWEDQWKNERLKPILKGIILAALKLTNPNTQIIYARKCQIKELDPKTYKEYCDKYHTQLSRPAQVRLGLFYQNELVQVASFSPYKGRNGKKSSKTEALYDWEWVRGCESFDHSRVIGGVSKLFSYFKKHYNPKSVLCYSDFNFFCGNGYAACGFELTGFTGPDKFYINEKGQRVNRNASKYREYMENVSEGKWLLCYGAGSLRFVWTAPIKN